MRPFDFDLRIGDAPLPAADAGILMKLRDVEESYTDEAGFLHRTVLRPRVRSWELRYSTLTVQQLRYLEQLLAEPSFTLRLRELDGSESACTACCTGLTVSHYDAPQGLYKDLKFTIEEC